jgi:hypothetical protein
MAAFADDLANAYVVSFMETTASKTKRTQRYNRRTPQPRGLKALDQDKFIKPLRVLQSYRCLPSHYVSKLSGYAHNTLKNESYPLLFHEGYIYVPSAAEETANFNYRPRPMALAPKGEKLLNWSGWGKPIERDTQQFKHMMMGELHRASCEIATLDIPYLSLIRERDILYSKDCPPETWRRALEDKLNPSAFYLANGQCIEPDDKIMGFYYAPPGRQPSSIFFTREDHRGTKDKKRLREQVRKYIMLDHEKVYRTQVGIPNCLHIWQTINEYVFNELEDVIMEETGGKGSSQICINLIPDYTSFHTFPEPTGWAVTQSYRRVKYSPVNILEELRKKAA